MYYVYKKFTEKSKDFSVNFFVLLANVTKYVINTPDNV